MIRLILKLTRPLLSIANGCTALGGYLVSPAPFEVLPAFAVVGGVTLLAAGASACNQVMERDVDRLMERTSRRPLPQGAMSHATALLIGGSCFMAGGLLLLFSGGILPVLLGAAAVAWYLGVYTLLKRRTSLAILLGAVCGAVPPVIGWLSAGGSPADFRIVLFAGVLYLWQIPHYLMVQHRHADDYRRAGIPFCGDRLAARNVYRLWLVALGTASALLPLLGIPGSHVVCWVVVVALPALISSFRCFETALVPYLNLFPLAVTALLAAQKQLP